MPFQIAKTHPSHLEPHVPQLVSYLSSPSLSSLLLTILVDLAQAHPHCVAPQLTAVQQVVNSQPQLMSQVAHITGYVAVLSQVRHIFLLKRNNSNLFQIHSENLQSQSSHDLNNKGIHNLFSSILSQ